MKEFDFSLVLYSDNISFEILESLLVDSELTDATISQRNGTFYLDFTRSGSNLTDTILTTIIDIENKTPFKICRIEPSDIVTSAEIARRLGRSRQSVQQLISGSRGSGDFPQPEAGITTKTLFWSWTDVVSWFLEVSIISDRSLYYDAMSIKALNIALSYRDSKELNQSIGIVLNRLNVESVL